MKKSIVLVAFFFVAASIINRSIEDNINAKKPSITEIAQTQSNLSKLGIALQRTDMLTTLKELLLKHVIG